MHVMHQLRLILLRGIEAKVATVLEIILFDHKTKCH